MIDRRLAALLFVAALLVAGCSSSDATSRSGIVAGGQLEGTEWILRSYAQEGELVLVEDTQYADAEFDKQRVSGRSGCNTYDARYRAAARLLFVSQPAVTFMACDETTMAFEQTFLTNLQASRWYGVHRDVLTILDASAQVVLVFDAAPRNPLLGPWVVDSFETVPNTIAAPIEDTELDVVFGIGSVGGFAGCNSFNGTYGTNGNFVRIGALATTRMACEQPIMDQETAFLDALQGVSFIDRTGPNTLNLTDRNGSLKVALVRPEEEAAAASPSPGASPTTAPSATPTPTPSPSPSPTPTASPSPTPTATATAAPTASATAAPTTAPTAAPTEPPALPEAANCKLTIAGATSTIAYPEDWSQQGCQYFDPGAIPGSPSPTTVAITALPASTSYADAVAAATDTASWEVHEQTTLKLTGRDVTLVEASATADGAGIPVGSSRLAYIVDMGTGGSLTLSTVGTAGDQGYTANAAILTIMMSDSTFGAPS